MLSQQGASQEKVTVISVIEKYTSVVTALARVKWTSLRDYTGIETLMGEAVELLQGVMNKVSTPLNACEPLF
jgi:hypothetical protein